GVYRGVEEARRRLDWLLLGQAARRATPVEDDAGRPDAGVAGVVPEEGNGAGKMKREQAVPKKRKPHEERTPEDYMDAADNALELAKVLAAQAESKGERVTTAPLEVKQGTVSIALTDGVHRSRTPTCVPSVKVVSKGLAPGVPWFFQAFT